MRSRIACPRSRGRWWNILAAVDGFVRLRGYWPSASDLVEYVDGALRRSAMSRELAELAGDPVPLLEYRRKAWMVTLEGFRALEREPVAARYPFRPRELPARAKRKRAGVVRKAAHEVFEGRGGSELPLVD